MTKTRKNKLLDKVIATSNARARKDIRQWRSALQQAENVERPRRTLLYNLYEELVIDAHVSAEMQKRILNVRGSDFSVFNAEGEADPDKTALFKKPWFYKFIDLAMQSLFWGHSLIQIGDRVDGEIQDVTLIHRKHVIPETGTFIAQQSDDKGILYREDRKYSGWLLEVGDPRNLGLLNKCAPHVLYKRFAQSAWSEFCEIFGMPIRIGKTNAKDNESLTRMENMMITMGTAAYAVVDSDEQVDFVETVKSNGEIYEGLMKFSNSELSKLINGAVIGEDSKNGSRSKEEVGERTGKAITHADKQWLEGFVNYQLIPKLISIGYALEGYTWRFEKAKDINGLWNITQGVLQHYDVEEDFIKNTFGIPVTGAKPHPTNPAPDLGADPITGDPFFG